MTLTPQDVANKEFLTVRLREGYDMQEVDQFLDEVEAELRRLYDENDQLRQGLLPEGAEAPPARVPEPEPTPDEAALAAADVHEEQAERVHRDPSEAPAAALTILTHAQTAADNLVDEARARADALIADATAKADGLVGEATERSEQLNAETERRRQELMGNLEREESDLRTRLDDLRAHEREYRSRLIAYHSEQARRLQEGQSDDIDVEAPFAGDPSSGIDAGISPSVDPGVEPGFGETVEAPSDDLDEEYRPS